VVLELEVEIEIPRGSFLKRQSSVKSCSAFSASMRLA